VAEAGVEEALAQLNPGAPQPVIDRTANGWGAPSSGIYGPVSRSLSSGSYSVVYTDDPLPVIYSTGYVTIPTFSATLKRVVRVGTANAPLFPVSGGARQGIDLKGNNVSTDSFNSALTNLSDNGRYPIGDPSKTSTNGSLASVAGIVNVGNADINGSVILGPTASDTIQANGSVSGGVTKDFNVEFEDVVLPQVSWTQVPKLSSPLAPVIDGISYPYVLTGINGNWIDSLSDNVYVPSNTVVTLKLTGNANPSNIRVAGKLILYMDGASFTLGSSEMVDNGNAANFSYYGTTNNTQFKMSGNAAFTGTLYAPEADITLGGGGNNDYDVVGAIIGNTITMNGHFHFHFDENLLANGPTRLVASSWREL
jgi:hypothetical protein